MLFGIHMMYERVCHDIRVRVSLCDTSHSYLRHGFRVPVVSMIASWWTLPSLLVDGEWMMEEGGGRSLLLWPEANKNKDFM